MNAILENDLKEILKSDIDWEYFNDKSILVTGATGMLATYIIETLLYLNITLDMNINVMALSRDLQRAKNRYLHHENNPNLIHIHGDLNQPVKVDGEVNIIIHTASLASPKFYKTEPVYTIKPNVIGTAHLLDICVEKKADQFLLFSSSEIYGTLCGESELLTENDYGIVDPLDLRSCYAESKRMAETMCIAWAEQYNLNVKIVRPFHTYGPGMRLDDGRVFADFVANIVNGENIKLKSDGLFSRPFCYITDATKAFFTVVIKGETKNAYNVANPEQNIRIRDLAKILVDTFSERSLEVEYLAEKNRNNMPSKIASQLPCINKLKKLGWSPSVSVADGFYRTVMSYE